MAKAKKPEQVYAYFKRKLIDVPHRASSWRGIDIPVDSPCGKECVAAIDHAAGLIEHIRAAGGIDSSAVILATEQVCAVYICG